jgi:hypothetical protein
MAHLFCTSLTCYTICFTCMVHHQRGQHDEPPAYCTSMPTTHHRFLSLRCVHIPASWQFQWHVPQFAVSCSYMWSSNTTWRHCLLEDPLKSLTQKPTQQNQKSTFRRCIYFLRKFFPEIPDQPGNINLSATSHSQHPTCASGKREGSGWDDTVSPL